MCLLYANNIKYLFNILIVNARYGGYGALYGNMYYAYIENLRQTNPALYAEWYHKYYANQQQQQQQHIARSVGNYPEDRASVHSGRSSCDDRYTLKSIFKPKTV